MKEPIVEHINIHSYQRLQTEALRKLKINLIDCPSLNTLNRVRNAMDLLLLYLVHYSFVKAHNIQITNSLRVSDVRNMLGYMIYITTDIKSNDINNVPSFNLLTRLQPRNHDSFFCGYEEFKELQSCLGEYVNTNAELSLVSDYLYKFNHHLIER
jgi:hypothetical protein